MPKLKSYQSFTRSLPIPLSSGETLTIQYCPARYNAEFHEKTNQGGKAMPDEEFLTEVLVGWDFEDEKGKAIPVTAEILRTEVAISDRAAMVRAIFSDVFPNETGGTSSS